MNLWSRIGDEYEQVVFCHDHVTGLRAIVAIHSTALGPALGGTRFYPYASDEDALVDVLRLARAMTYKSALAGLDLGGGKAVIIGDPTTIKTEALLRAYGRFVNSLGGRYLTAEDVGTTQADMDMILRETTCVTGMSPVLGGSGDPSDATAEGVWSAMRAVADYVGGSGAGGSSGGLGGMHVVVSGVGKVGSALVRRLVGDGAKVTVSDVNATVVSGLVEELGVATAEVSSAHGIPCDIFAPGAVGGVINPRTIPELQCRAIVGAANNQLESDDDAALLAARRIVYVPDFLVNAGGVINLADELAGYHRARALASVRRIGETTRDVLDRAARTGVTTVVASLALADDRIAGVAASQRIRTFTPPARHRP